MSTSVFVSGATGYIAQHIVQQLLAKGYKVVGTVRSASKGDKLKENLKSENFSYEIVEDIGVKGAFNEALKAHPEVTVFLHTASPFHFNTTDAEKDLLLPAREGTKNALEAIKEFGPQIKRVVVTSSYAAIFTLEKERDPTVTFNEKSWNEISWEAAKENALTGYVGSKKFAEEAAWDFVKAEKPNFVLSTVNPVFVFGPQAFDSEVKGTLNTSAEIINQILKLSPTDPVPDTTGAYIDVRDVARAHLVAFEKKEAENERLILSDARFSSQMILDIVNEKFAKEVSGKVPVGKPDTGLEQTKNMAIIDNKLSKEILGFKFIDLEKTVVDTIQQILDVNGKI